MKRSLHARPPSKSPRRSRSNSREAIPRRHECPRHSEARSGRSKASRMTKYIAICAVFVLAAAPLQTLSEPRAPAKMKLRGYITARPSDQVIAILDDQLSFTPATRIELQNGPAGQNPTNTYLVPGAIIDSEGI